MRYLGGKWMIRRKIAAAILAQQTPKHTHYVEPFLGSGAVVQGVLDAGLTLPLVLSDGHPDLILLYQAVRDGWTPPSEVSEADYKALQYAEPSALRGFVGFGCSFAGKFFGGYARTNRGDDIVGAAVRSVQAFVGQLPPPRNYAAETAKGITAIVGQLPQTTELVCSDYQTLIIPGCSLIYCDPPYVATTKYSLRFDAAEFWQTTARWASQGHTVLVSEYNAPANVKCVWEHQRVTAIRPKNGNELRTERLFAVGG